MKKIGNKIVLIYILLLIIPISSFSFVLSKNYDTLKTNISEYFHKLYLSTVDVSSMEISTVLLDEDNNQYTSYDWYAEDYKDTKTLIYQINYKKNNLSASYKPGDLEIEVNNIYFDLTNMKNASIYQSKMKNYIIVSADPKGNSTHLYEWSYKFSSDYSKITFYNNNTLPSNMNFEGTIRIKYIFTPFSFIDGSETDIQAKLNDSVLSNSINFKFSAKTKVLNGIEKINKITSYDDMPAGDYTWISYKIDYNFSDGTKLPFDFKFKIDGPDGIRIIRKYGNKELPNNEFFDGYSVSYYYPGAEDMYKNLTHIYNFDELYIGIPNDLGDTVSFSVEIDGRYYYIGYSSDPIDQIIFQKNVTVDLSEYRLIDEGFKYSYDSSYYGSLIHYDNIKNHRESYAKGNIIRITNTSRKNIDVLYGRDIVSIVKQNGDVDYLTDNDYKFNSILFPGERNGGTINGTIKNGNNSVVPSGVYNVDLYVRYKNEEEYILYDSFLNEGKVYNSFEKDVVAYYFYIHDVDISLQLSTDYGIIFSNTNSIEQQDKLRDFIMFNATYNGTDIFEATQSNNYIKNYDLSHYSKIMLRFNTTYSWQSFNPKAYGYIKYNPIVNMNNGEYKTEINSSNEYDVFSAYKFYGVELFVILPEGMYTLDNEGSMRVYPSFENIENVADDLQTDTLYKTESGLSFKTSEELDEYINSKTQIELINNWNNSNRQVLHVNIDLTDDPFLTDSFYRLDNYYYYNNLRLLILTPTLDVYLNQGSLYEYGTDYIVTLNSILKGYDATSGGIYYLKDVDDLDNDGNKEEYYFANTYLRNVSYVTESSQSLKTTAKSDKDNYDETVKVSFDNQYTYKLRARAGANKITNLVIYDSIEKYIKRENRYDLASDGNESFNGTFQGVNTSYAESQGYTVKVYYSENDKPGSLGIDSSWKAYTSSIDKTKVKSLAFEYLDNAGNKAILPEDSLIYVEVIMKSPTKANTTAMITYNGSWVEWNALDSTNNIIPGVVGINSNVASVSLPATLTVKHLNKNNDKELASEEYYDTYEYGDNYTTSASTSIPANFEFKETSGDDPSGTISKLNTVVIYYYNYIEPTIDYDAEESYTRSIDKRDNTVNYYIKAKYYVENYLGDISTDERYCLEYDIDLSKSDLDGGVYNSTTKEILWSRSVNVESMDKHEYEYDHEISLVFKNIPIDDRDIQTTRIYGIDYNTNNHYSRGLHSVLKTQINEKYKITVKHLENGTNKVVAPEETYYKYYNDEYEYGISSELPGNYQLKTRPDNYKGNVLSEETVITYLYEKKTPTLTSSLNINGTNEITKRTTAVSYDINFNSTVKDYIGSGTTNLVATLPYEIDISKSNLSGGTYNSTNRTITWNSNFNVTSADETPVNVSKSISLVYKNIPIDVLNITLSGVGTINTESNNKQATGSKSTTINEQYKITVKHLEAGTNKVVAPEETYYKYYNDPYEYGISSELPGDYQLKTRPSNYKGNVLSEETVITYLYEKKTPVLTNTSSMTRIESIDGRTKPVTYNVSSTSTVRDYIGTGTVNEVIDLPYEIDISKSNLDGGTYNNSTKKITWSKSYETTNVTTNTIETSHEISVVYKNIPIDVTIISATYTSTVNTEFNSTSSSRSTSTGILEKYKITVKHLEYDTNKVLASEETYYKLYNEEYITEVSNSLPDNYELKIRPTNYRGNVLAEETIVTYYYQLVDSTLTSEISSECPEEVNSREDPIEIKIKYNVKINSYIGEAKVIIENELPYEIDEEKSDLDGAIYDKDNKKLTWIFNENIESVEQHEKEYVLGIIVVFKDIDINEKIINNVSGVVQLTNNSDSKETASITDIKIYGNIVIKYIDENNNVLDTLTSNGLVNDIYIPVSKEIEGYNLISVPESLSYRYGEGEITLYYTYKKIEAPIKVEENPATGKIPIWLLAIIPTLFTIVYVVLRGRSVFKKM